MVIIEIIDNLPENVQFGGVSDWEGFHCTCNTWVKRTKVVVQNRSTWSIGPFFLHHNIHNASMHATICPLHVTIHYLNLKVLILIRYRSEITVMASMVQPRSLNNYMIFMFMFYVFLYRLQFNTLHNASKGVKPFHCRVISNVGYFVLYQSRMEFWRKKIWFTT